MTTKHVIHKDRQHLLAHAKGVDERRRVAPPQGSYNGKATSPTLGELHIRNSGSRSRPEDVAVLYERGLAAFQSGNFDLASNLIARACVGIDVPSAYYQIQAEILCRCGKLDAATKSARLAVEKDRKSAVAWNTLGVILANSNNLAESKTCYEAAIRLDPSLLEAINNLAIVLQRLGQLRAAEAHYCEILRRKPDHLEASLNFACLLGVLGRYQEALAIVERVINRSPDSVRAYLLASALECNVAQYNAALLRIDQAIACAPDQIKILTRRAEIRGKLGNGTAALADCDLVLSKLPADAETLHVKALILRALNRPEEALTALRSAESTSTDPVNEIVDGAWLLAEMGRKEEALVVLDQTLSAQPNSATALYCRAFLTRYTSDHADLAAMESIVSNADTPHRERMRLSFSLGKAYLDIGDGTKAFYHLNSANRLKHNTFTYEPHAEANWFAGIADAFSAESMSYFAAGEFHSNRPIFVFGMPRSGTTLVEQILASHRLVRGTGESSYLSTLAKTSVFQRSISGFTPDNFTSCGRQYLNLAGSAVPEPLLFVDKTTSNFLYAGLISLILPGARMIHCRRDPLDTCLSCYSLLFADGHEFSYDLAELGHYYHLYRELMAHWREVLPKAAILDVNYETLVDDPEEQVRRILDFCTLPWDASCLRFYETKRLVTSSSLDQVRLPIYKTSVGRAQIFRPWLGALEAALESQSSYAI